MMWVQWQAEVPRYMDAGKQICIMPPWKADGSQINSLAFVRRRIDLLSKEWPSMLSWTEDHASLELKVTLEV